MELLSVSPQQLTFYAPFNLVQRRIVTLLNPTYKVVLFKFISNASEHYGVMPNHGKVEPYNTTEIRISLRCFDFKEGEKYQHRFRIHSIHKPSHCFNGENALAIFRRLSHGEIYIKTLPIKLEANSVFMSNSGLDNYPSLKQLVMERNQQQRPLRPKRQKKKENSMGPPKEEKSPECSIISMVVVLVIGLGGIFIAYLQRKEMAEMMVNFYEDHMYYSEDSFASPELSGVNST